MKRVKKSQGRDLVMRTLPLYILLSLKHLRRIPQVMKSRPLGPTLNPHRCLEFLLFHSIMDQSQIHLQDTWVRDDRHLNWILWREDSIQNLDSLSG